MLNTVKEDLTGFHENEPNVKNADITAGTINIFKFVGIRKRI